MEDDTLQAINQRFDRLEDLLTQLIRNVADFRAEIRGEMNEFRTEMREEMNEFRTEIREEMNMFRTEMRGEVDGFRNDVDAEFKKVHVKLSERDAEVALLHQRQDYQLQRIAKTEEDVHILKTTRH